MRKKNGELKAELEKSIQEVQEAKIKSKKIERLYTNLQEHLAENNFAPRLYSQIIENWK